MLLARWAEIPRTGLLCFVARRDEYLKLAENNVSANVNEEKNH